MKQKDVALIIIIAFVSAVISFFVSNKIFVAPSNRQQGVQVVDKISPSFQQPDQKYFNSGSIDPTQTPSINTNNNQTPFNGNSQ
jgi:hypothetical protein